MASTMISELNLIATTLIEDILKVPQMTLKYSTPMQTHYLIKEMNF